MGPLMVANDLIAPSSLREATNTTVVATATVNDHVHVSMGGLGGSNNEGLPLVRRGC